MIIDTLKKEHIPALVDIEKACFGDSAWTYEGFLGELNGAFSVFLCAVEGDTVFGCICMNTTEEQGFISKVMVAPAHRREGIAKAMLQALIQYAAQAGMRELTLEVRESNIPARSLYTAFGFKNLGKRRNFYHSPKEDAVIMTKVL